MACIHKPMQLIRLVVLLLVAMETTPAAMMKLIPHPVIQHTLRPDSQIQGQSNPQGHSDSQGQYKSIPAVFASNPSVPAVSIGDGAQLQYAEENMNQQGKPAVPVLPQTENLMRDCLRKAKMVYYRIQISREQPEFVRACEMVWRMFLQKSREMHRRQQSGRPKKIPRSANRWANIFQPPRHFQNTRIVDEKRGEPVLPKNGLSAAEEESQHVESAGNHDGLGEKMKTVTLNEEEDVATQEAANPANTGPNHSRTKRAPWAGSESRYNILDMIRTQMHNRGKKRAKPRRVALGRTQAGRGLLRQKRGATYLDMPESMGREEMRKYFLHPFSAQTKKKIPRPSQVHPFVGGIGDYAAEMALKAYAQLLTDEFSNPSDKTTRNARPFIG